MWRTAKTILMVAITPLPSKIKILIFRHVFGFDVADDAHVGMSLIFCRKLVLGPRTFIGHMSIVKGDMTLHMKAGSVIGQFNWITAGNTDPRYFKNLDRHPELILGEESSITSRHLLDCTDRIKVGCFTTIAGYRSIILTHGIDYRTAKQDCQPVAIGDHCLIGSNVTVLKGVTVANRSVIGAGSVVTKPIEQELGLWVGAPARRLRDLTGEEYYFSRANAHIY
jgi:acetyltransferase-like isoleucine patch superfamily enzyme